MGDLVRVLAEPNRRRLLELLLGGEQPVSRLASHFAITRSAVSQHLGVLARAGLVQVRSEGRFRFYRVDPEGLARLRSSLDVFWAREFDELVSAGSSRKGAVTMGIEKSAVVPLDADETFALLTEPERLRRWQAVTARIDLRAGGEYRWTVVPGHTAAGTVVEVEPGRRLVITWGWEDAEDLPPGSSTVTITLEPAVGGTLVRLVHEGLTEAQATGHAEGWSHYLDRLVLAASAGDAGADQWVVDRDPSDKLTAAEAALASCQLVLRGLTDSDGASATPCARFTVDELVDHLLESISHLGGMAGVTVDPGGGTREARVATAAQQALEAWRRRGIDGEVQFGAGTIPASLAANILSVELLVHAWDLAQASAQRVVSSDALDAFVLGLSRELIAPQMRDGDRFGPEVEVGPDAGALDRLVAFTGRTPAGEATSTA